MARASTKKSVPAVKANETMPAFLEDKMDSNRGSEDVTHGDLVIPRLDIVQALSPCRDESDPAYIKGAKEGLIYNNVTRELFGNDVIVCPVAFKKEYLLWRDRKVDNGGFHGAFASYAEAEAARDELERSENVEIVDTHQQFCLLVRSDGSLDEVVISMAKSKAKVSRNWNSLIRINGGDRFSRLYKVETINDENQNGDKYRNYKITNHGFVTEDIYRVAENMYNAVQAGRASADRSIEESTEASDDGEM